MPIYKVLNKEIFSFGSFSIVPIRIDDRFLIMKWRNEQIYHLRQQKPIAADDQEVYFANVIAKLFDQDHPEQILFSYLKDDLCIGYGGLVHINWIDKNAEISFIMDTSLEKKYFFFHWQIYLGLIEKVAFEELGFHKIFTYAFDLRPKLYDVLEESGYVNEARLQDHCFFEGKYIDVIIHSKFNNELFLRDAKIDDLQITYLWANHPHTREFAFNKDLISFETHSKWFQRKLHNGDCIYKIFIRDGEPIGSIRFDIKDGEGLISYLISPELTGKGFGKKILEYGILSITLERPQIKTLKGLVQKENIASIRIFKKLGFERTDFNDGILEFKKEI